MEKLKTSMLLILISLCLFSCDQEENLPPYNIEQVFINFYFLKKNINPFEIHIDFKRKNVIVRNIQSKSPEVPILQKKENIDAIIDNPFRIKADKINLNDKEYQKLLNILNNYSKVNYEDLVGNQSDGWSIFVTTVDKNSSVNEISFVNEIDENHRELLLYLFEILNTKENNKDLVELLRYN